MATRVGKLRILCSKGHEELEGAAMVACIANLMQTGTPVVENRPYSLFALVPGEVVVLGEPVTKDSVIDPSQDYIAIPNYVAG